MKSIESITNARISAIKLKAFFEEKIPRFSKSNCDDIVEDVTEKLERQARENLSLKDLTEKLIFEHISVSHSFTNNNDLVAFLNQFGTFIGNATHEELMKILNQYIDELYYYVEGTNRKDKIIILNDLKDKLLENGLTCAFNAFTDIDRVSVTVTAQIPSEEEINQRKLTID